MDPTTLTPWDFTSWNKLETKIYNAFKNKPWDPQYKYIHADHGIGVRMLFIQYKSNPRLYYCVNKKGVAIIPATVENELGDEVLKEEYKVEVLDNVDIDFFMENLGQYDIVRTHEMALLPAEYKDGLSDSEIYKKLVDYIK